MKFKNIKVGMKLQHKETGDIYTVLRFIAEVFVLDYGYPDKDGYHCLSIGGNSEAYLFRKYSEAKQ